MQTKSKKKALEKKKRKDLVTFISELREELKKVTWTTKPELISATKIVIVSTLAFGIGIYVVDLIIKGILEAIKSGFLFIFG